AALLGAAAIFAGEGCRRERAEQASASPSAAATVAPLSGGATGGGAGTPPDGVVADAAPRPHARGLWLWKTRALREETDAGAAAAIAEVTRNGGINEVYFSVS